MKTNNLATHDVIVHGAQESGNFSIAANGKAFKILIDGLYSNKIQAIVRELSSNAFDAQAAAGRRDTQFEIQAPNMLDPTFAIRDYGTSLSHADIMGLYTTVFQSTKEDNNDSVGKFGLGSKTPFAYTDNFTVTAFMRGTKRVYSAYMNVNNIPQISLMASEDTSELDGLMVSFPVNVKDIDSFRREIAVVLEGFDILPKIKGAVIEPKSNGEIILTGSCYKIFKKVNYNNNSGPRARQGCVIYPLDKRNLPDTISQAVKNILDTNIIIDFEIGELDITPSRETLSYDEATIGNIVNRLEAIDEEIVRELKEEYSNIRSFYEATMFYIKHSNNSDSTPSQRRFINNLTFNGRRVNNTFNLNRDQFLRNYNVKISRFNSFEMARTLKFKESKYSQVFHLTNDTFIVVERLGNDAKKLKHISARIKGAIEGHNSVLWVKDFGATKKQWRKFLKYLGYPPVIYELDQLELPVKDKEIAPSVIRIARDEIRILKAVRGQSYYDEEVIDLTKIDPKDYRYVVLFNKTYKIDSIKSSDIDLEHYFDDLSKILIINKRQINKIERYGIVNAFPEVEQKLAKEFDFEAYKNAVMIEDSMNHPIKKHASEIVTFNYENKETSFGKFFSKLQIFAKGYGTGSENLEKYETWKAVAPIVKVKAYESELDETPQKVDSLKELLDEVMKDYPLTKHFLNIKNYDTIKEETLREIVDYVKLIDTMNEKEHELNV